LPLGVALGLAFLLAAVAGGRLGTEAASARPIGSSIHRTLQQRAAQPGRANRKHRSLFPRFVSAVPVLLYHRILAGNGRGVAAATFDAQLRRLHGLGFETITLDQYVRFARHEAVDLPPRPVLITFDDGYVSAVEEADPVLARYGWTAVMYVPTATVGTPGRLTWGALRQMRSSGRWQIAEHAGDGHVLITVDSEGRRLPFYANEQWTNGKQESFAHYKRRVTTDIERGSAILARNLPGWTPHLSFAIPFGDYGQRGSNDRRIEPWLSDYLKTRFVVTFVQRDDSFTTPDPGFANRITVAANWNANTLESHLFLGLDRLTPVSARNRISPHSR
jgi:hypothetical protein